MKLGILTPSCYPDRLETFGKSMRELLRLKDHCDIKLLMNYSGPMDIASIEKFEFFLMRMREYDMPYDYQYNTYSKPAPMMRIREETARIDPSCDVYLFADDDFIFTARGVNKYIHCIDYMKRFPKCGVICCKGSLGGHLQKDRIDAVHNFWVWTARGLFVRNMKNHFGTIIMPPETLSFKGGLTESVATYSRMAAGYFVARQMNNLTRHKTKARLSHDIPIDDLHNLTLLEQNAAGYIKKRWNDPRWSIKRMPKGLLKQIDMSPYSGNCSYDYGRENV